MIRVLSQLVQKAHSRVLGAFSGSVDPSVGQVRAVALSAMLLVSLVAVGGATAQFQGTWSDDFEDETVGEVPGGWDTENPTVEVRQTGSSGDRSVYIETSSVGAIPDRSLTWDNGPTLNLSEEFTIQGTIRHDQISGSASTAHSRIGIVDDLGDQDANALLMFNDAENVTILSSETGVDAATLSTTDDNVMADSFEGDWINYEMVSDGNGGLEATVWRVGEAKPSNPQLTANFSGTSGLFTADVGTDSPSRSITMDDVSIEGETTDPESETLDLDVQRYMSHGTTQDYQVIATVNDTMGPGNTTVDVTDDSTVTSADSDVITVDESAQTLNATSNTSINERVAISATYQGQTASENVTVANATLDNAQILPGTWRATAMISDDTIFFLIIVAMIMGVIGRYATAFAGLGMGQLAVAIGWWGGYVPEGVAMVSVFLVLFIGFNVAVNVDYTVQR